LLCKIMDVCLVLPGPDLRLSPRSFHSPIQWVQGHPPLGSGTSVSGYRGILQWVPGHPHSVTGTSVNRYRDIRQWVPEYPPLFTGTSTNRYRASASGYRGTPQWVPELPLWLPVHPPLSTGTSASGYRGIRKWVPGHPPLGTGASASGYRHIRQWVPGHPPLGTGTSVNGCRNILLWIPGHLPQQHCHRLVMAMYRHPVSKTGMREPFTSASPRLWRCDTWKFLPSFYIECTHHTVHSLWAVAAIARRTRYQTVTALSDTTIQ
jgi:hypothetical protein